MAGRMIPAVQADEVGRRMLAGALATVVMSGVIAAGWAVGLFRMPPPKEIMANAAALATDATDTEPPAQSAFEASSANVPSRVFQVGWVTAHLMYGALCGALFGVLQGALWFVPGRPLGVAFGLAVWLVSYLGVMPALRLYPWPTQDSPGRLVTMIVAHLVFGLSLPEIDRRLARR